VLLYQKPFSFTKRIQNLMRRHWKLFWNASFSSLFSCCFYFALLLCQLIETSPQHYLCWLPRHQQSEYSFELRLVFLSASYLDESNNFFLSGNQNSFCFSLVSVMVIVLEVERVVAAGTRARHPWSGHWETDRSSRLCLRRTRPWSSSRPPCRSWCSAASSPSSRSRQSSYIKL